MPDVPGWFRHACRWLWRPDQCTNCGSVRCDGRYIRDGFLAFCSVSCSVQAREKPCRVCSRTATVRAGLGLWFCSDEHLNEWADAQAY